MKHKVILKHIFNKEIKENAFLYEKINSSNIILFKWENGFAYRAKYRCIPSNIATLDAACSYVENKFDILNRRGEYYMFADEMESYFAKDVYIRELNYNDMQILEEMKSECALSDVELAQIMISDLHILGAFINGKLVGLSSILDLWNAYDIGVLVHPEYRRMGVSSMLVSENAKCVLGQNKICMYRCDDFNIGSINTARKLGFKKEIEVVIYDLKK